jgi:hypothetical protein
MKVIAIGIALTVFLYLVFSFVAVSFDPNQWAIEGRVLFGFFVIAMSGVLVAWWMDLQEKQPAPPPTKSKRRS